MSLDHRLRLRATLDILAILAELPDYDDALAVITSLSKMHDYASLRALFRPNELPATTRRNIAEQVGEPAPESEEP